MSYSKGKLKGFLIAEVLIASFVLMVGLLGTTELIRASLQNSFDNRDSIIAIGLAQEGVELVRNVRDNDFIAGGNGFTNFPSSSKKHCLVDYNDTDLNGNCHNTVGTASRYYLQYNNNNFYSHHNNGADNQERYSRYIYINYDNTAGAENALVRSFVYWEDSSFSPDGSGSTTNCTLVKKCVYTELALTNWN